MAEIKLFTPHDFELKEDGELVVAFAQTDAVDSDEDYTFPGFVTEGKRVPISHYGHGSWPQKGGHLPTGIGELKEDGGWAILRGGFFMKTTHGRDHYETVKGMGDEQQWSYGYDVTEKAAPPEGVKAKRGIKKANVYEVSPVLLGAQGTAHTMAIKSAEQDLLSLEGDDAAEAIELLKEGLLAGLPFAEMSERVLHGIEAFTSRAEAIAEIRVKEGRALSTARVAELQSHHDALMAGATAIKKLLEGAAPKPKEESDDDKKARRMRMEARLGEASMSLASLRTH